MIRHLIQQERATLQHRIDLCRHAHQEFGLEFYVNEVKVISEWRAQDLAVVAEYDRLLADLA